jgi:predicted N-acetyltransferase YhbS
MEADMIQANRFARAAVVPSFRHRPVRIETERLADVAAREALLDAAFGPLRALKTCERLREGRMPARGLALVARRGPRLVGTLRLWHVDAGAAAALLLGPLAVAAEERGAGVGAALMTEALSRAGGAGHGAVLLVGDAPYYRRFGFAPEFTQRLILPGPVERNRFLARELEPGALAGAAGPVRATGALALPGRRRAAARVAMPLVPAA